MNEESFDAWQALVDLHSSWEQQLESVRVSAAGLLSASRDQQRLSPVADRQRRTRLIEAATTASVLHQVCEDFVEVLGEIEEWRISRYPAAHAAHAQASTAGVDRSPDHPEPVPEGGGPERTPSGQGKSSF